MGWNLASKSKFPTEYIVAVTAEVGYDRTKELFLIFIHTANIVLIHMPMKDQEMYKQKSINI